MFIAHKISSLLFIFQMSLTPCIASSRSSFFFHLYLTHPLCASTKHDSNIFHEISYLLTAIHTSYYHHNQQQAASCIMNTSENSLSVLFEWRHYKKWEFLPKKGKNQKKNEFVVKSECKNERKCLMVPMSNLKKQCKRLIPLLFYPNTSHIVG